MQRSVGEVRRVNFDCNKRNMGEYAFDLFMSLFSQFLEFWLFRRGPFVASDSHFFVTFVKGPVTFCYFRYFRNFRDTIANVLGFFIT